MRTIKILSLLWVLSFFYLSSFAQNPSEMDTPFFKGPNEKEIREFIEKEFTQRRPCYRLFLNKNVFIYELGIQIERLSTTQEYLLAINGEFIKEADSISEAINLTYKQDRTLKILSYRYNGELREEPGVILSYVFPKTDKYGIEISKTQTRPLQFDPVIKGTILHTGVASKIQKEDKIIYYTPDGFLGNLQHLLRQENFVEARSLVQFMKKWYFLASQTQEASHLLERAEEEKRKKEEEWFKILAEKKILLEKEQIEQELQRERERINAYIAQSQRTAEFQQKERENQQKRTEGLIKIAQELLEIGQFEEAEKKLKEAAKGTPDDPLIEALQNSLIESRLAQKLQEEKARIAKETEKAKKEVEYRQKERENQKQIAMALLQATQELIQCSSLEEAEKKLKEANLLYPNAPLWLSLSEELQAKRLQMILEKQQEELRIETEKKVLETQRKQNEEAYRQKLAKSLIQASEELLKVGDIENAEQQLYEAEKWDPRDPFLLVLKSSINEEKLNNVQKFKKEKAERYVLAGHFYFERQDYLSAGEKYKEALNLDPTHLEAQNQRLRAKTEYFKSENATLLKGLEVFPVDFKNNVLKELQDLQRLENKSALLDLFVLQTLEPTKALFQEITGESPLLILGEIKNDKFKTITFQEKKAYRLLGSFGTLSSYSDPQQGGVSKEVLTFFIDFIE
jgi:tetratricopeptide (TPR) repeat protein